MLNKAICCLISSIIIDIIIKCDVTHEARTIARRVSIVMNEERRKKNNKTKEKNGKLFEIRYSLSLADDDILTLCDVFVFIKI